MAALSEEVVARSGGNLRLQQYVCLPVDAGTTITVIAAPPSWANTISCSSVCSGEYSSCAEAAGATVRLGSTRDCSRQRYHDVAISGRTPRTRSSPERNRSRAAGHGLVSLRIAGRACALRVRSFAAPRERLDQI